MGVHAKADVRVELRDEAAARPRRTMWGDVWHRLRRNRPAILGLAVIILMYLTAIFAPLIAPYEYDKIDLDNVR